MSSRWTNFRKRREKNFYLSTLCFPSFYWNKSQDSNFVSKGRSKKKLRRLGQEWRKPFGCCRCWSQFFVFPYTCQRVNWFSSMKEPLVLFIKSFNFLKLKKIKSTAAQEARQEKRIFPLTFRFQCVASVFEAFGFDGWRFRDPHLGKKLFSQPVWKIISQPFTSITQLHQSSILLVINHAFWLLLAFLKSTRKY